MTKIRVLIIDDQAILRAGLRAFLNAQPDLQVVGEGADLEEALSRSDALHPDVVTVDLAPPGANSGGRIKQLRVCYPHSRVLVLTRHDDPTYLRQALAAGADGYLVKTATDTELLSAIRAVHQGRTFIDLHLSGCLLQALFAGPEGLPVNPPHLAGPSALSQRERQVLELLAYGHTHQQIADRLVLSIKTVETYRARVAEKLGLHTRADLIRYALDAGLLVAGKPLPPPQN